MFADNSKMLTSPVQQVNKNCLPWWVQSNLEIMAVHSKAATASCLCAKGIQISNVQKAQDLIICTAYQITYNTELYPLTPHSSTGLVSNYIYLSHKQLATSMPGWRKRAKGKKR